MCGRHDKEELKQRYANEESEFANIQGVQLHYRDEGDATKPAGASTPATVGGLFGGVGATAAGTAAAAVGGAAAVGRVMVPPEGHASGHAGVPLGAPPPAPPPRDAAPPPA